MLNDNWRKDIWRSEWKKNLISTYFFFCIATESIIVFLFFFLSIFFGYISECSTDSLLVSNAILLCTREKNNDTGSETHPPFLLRITYATGTKKKKRRRLNVRCIRNKGENEKYAWNEGRSVEYLVNYILFGDTESAPRRKNYVKIW